MKKLASLLTINGLVPTYGFGSRSRWEHCARGKSFRLTTKNSIFLYKFMKLYKPQTHEQTQKKQFIPSCV